MQKALLGLFLLCFIPFSYAKARDFEELMGKGASCWKYVQTTEDFERIDFFRTLYEKQSSKLAKKPSSKQRTPKVFHFIWLGPDPFPKQSVDRIAKWVELHPDWSFKFWTDQDRVAPHSVMEKCFAREFSFHLLGNEYYHSINFGEKAKILAYEILHKEGGVYVDHDLLPYHPFDRLNEQFDFYCGLEKPAPSILSSSIIPGTHLIASRPRHPVIAETMKWLSTHWDQLELSYPGKGKIESSNRILHRTFWALSEGIDRGINLKGNSDVVLPTSYFNDCLKHDLSYAVHYHDAQWSNPPSRFEARIEKRFDEMIKKDDEAVLLTIILSAVSFLGCVCLLVYGRSIKKGMFCLLPILLSISLQGSEFSRLMGKETPHWNYLVNREDFQTLEKFEELYEKNKHLRFSEGSPYKIAKTVHFIWLGPRPFPPESVENVRTWVAHHPDWKFKFWTDRERLPPCKGMEVCLVDSFPFLFLRHCYDESDNWGEKSDVLRFEILYQEGGVYADHDANCLQKFDGLHQGFDFYCGLEAPHPPFAGRNITSGNGVIGARSFHPVVGRVIELIGKEWADLGEKYRGRDGYSRSQLVMERTYMKLSYALEERLEEDGNRDIVLPAAYFFAKKDIPSLYSKHFFADSWSDDSVHDVEFEKTTKKAMNKLQRRNKTILSIARVALVVNLSAFTLIFLYLVNQKKGRRRES